MYALMVVETDNPSLLGQTEIESHWICPMSVPEEEECETACEQRTSERSKSDEENRWAKTIMPYQGVCTTAGTMKYPTTAGALAIRVS